MNLDTLVQTFRSQATSNNAIVLNNDVLPQSELDKLSTSFLLGENQFLTVTNITAADIPDPVNGKLQISAGITSVLKQSNVIPRLTFTVDANGVVQYLIAAQMTDKWKFTDSFPNLTLFPFNQITPTKTNFVYSSLAQDSYFPWADKPDETISLAAGLNFVSWMTLNIFSGAITLLLQILNTTTAYKFAGPFSPDNTNPYPVTTLTTKLGTETFQVTDDLTIGNLSLSVDISDSTTYDFQTIGLSLAANTSDLLFSVDISEGDPSLTFAAGPMPGHQVTADEIVALPGGADFQQYIPAELTDAFKDCALKEFTIVLTDGNAVGFISFSIGTVVGFMWALIPGVLTLADITLELAFFDPFSSDELSEISMGASCQLFPTVFPGTFDFKLEMDDAGPNQTWEITTISGNYYGSANLGDVVSAIVGPLASVPQEISDISFSDFGADVTKQDSGYVYSLHGQCNAAFPMLDSQLVSALTVVARYSKLGYDVDLNGSLGINEQNFALELKLSESSGSQGTTGFLHASWSVDGTDYLEFEDFARTFDFSDSEIPNIPEGLDLSLKSAALTYDFGKKQVGIGLESATYGSADFVILQNPSTRNWQFFFGFAIGKPVSLTHLPVVENFLPTDDTIEVDQIQVVLSSYQIDAKLAGSINTLIATLGSNYPQVPNSDNTGMPAGVNFSLTVDFGSIQFPVVIGTGPVPGPQESATPAPLLLTADNSTAAPPSSPSSTRWFTVGKTFGPVSFQRVGVQYQNSKLYFLLDASVTLSDFTLGMNGLGVGSPLTSFAPEAHIDGISVSFSSDSITVAGGLLVAPPPLPSGVTEEYLGEVTIAIESYLITGVGSYAKVDGNPSVFIFAQIEGAFGGPPAFFITGFMGGLGYNSQLTLPTVDQVLTFPFVAGLDDPTIFGANPTPLDVMNVLSGAGGKTAWVTPTTGETWIAGGVMFRSFELVLGRVLLVVSFGKDFEVSLLGLASMSLPQGATKDAYAYVELQLEAVFKPDDGFFSILGSVTPNSFLLTKDCHLTGGFAFCMWFGSNPHAGDFVVTVGGYHPAFVVPSWYPQVPRLGFNWPAGGGVTIKGDCYFAITPTAAMAGGSLEVLYQSGDLRAWFTAYANLMIRWKPFYFTASIGISVGASYRMNLLFTSVTVSVEMGATLNMWGPPTGGKVYVDWYIISFSVSFGSNPVNPAQMTLDWTEFQGLLPNNQPAPQATLLAAAPPGNAVVLTVNINQGLTRQDSSGAWIVRADELVFTTQTAVPASELHISGKVLPLPAGAPGKINIRPMKQQGVSSIHSVSLTSVDEKKDIDLTAWPAPVAQTSNLPESLWGAPISDNSTPAPAAATIPNLPTGIQFAPPPASSGPSLGPVDPANLIDPLGGGYLPLSPSQQHDPIPAPVVDADSITEIMTTLAAPATLQTQQLLVSALQRLGAAPPTSSPLTQLAQQAGTLFSEAPLRTA